MRRKKFSILGPLVILTTVMAWAPSEDHRLSQRMGLGTNLLKLHVGEHESTSVRRLVVQNLDLVIPVTYSMQRNGTPDLTSIDGMLASLIRPTMSAEQKCVAIWQFLVDWRYHDYPAEGGGEVHDAVRFVNVYGYGFCDDSAAVFCQLATAAGFKTRSYGLSGHVVAEAFYDGEWHMFDPDHQVIYRRDDGRIAGVEYLQEHPELITRSARDPIGSDTASIARLYTTTADNRPFQAARSNPMTLTPTLGPGDRVEFDFRPQGSVHRRLFSDQRLPPKFGNGRLQLRLSANGNATDSDEHVVHFHWPYVLLGADISGKLAPGGREPWTPAISSDRRSWTPLAILRNGERWTGDAGHWLAARPTATYEFWLRLPASSGARTQQRPPSVDIRATFQFAPRALVPLVTGDNVFRVEVRSAERLGRSREGSPRSGRRGKPFRGLIVELD